MNDTGVEITAGLGGFLAVFFLAIALILLGLDLNKRLRRLRHQEELRLEEEEERRAAEAPPEGSAPDDSGPDDSDPEGLQQAESDGRP